MTADSPNKNASTLPGVRLRPARPGDLETLAFLHQSALSPLRTGADTPDPALKTRIREGCILVAVHRGRTVAYAGFHPDEAVIAGPYVEKPYQGQGVGSRLLTAVERLAASMQLFQLGVQAPRQTTGFFESHGYRPTDSTKGASQSLCRSFPRRQTVQGRHVAKICESLGIPTNYGQTHRLPVRSEAKNLRSAGKDIYDRPQRLAPDALSAWTQMKAAATAEGIELQLVSAFRSVEYQAGLLARKLDKGIAMSEILKVSAAPGFSEHHTGLALDITTPGSPVLEEAFEETNAFRWLLAHAGNFGFHLSYPKDNPHGVAYEPWHWAHKLAAHQ